MQQIYWTSVLIFFITISTYAQKNDYWHPVNEGDFTEKGVRQIIPLRYKTFKLDIAAIQTEFDQTPLEYNTANEKHRIVLPMPDGRFEQFEIVESAVMEAGLAAKFPQIKTYLGQGIDNPRSSVRLSWTHKGFHAMVISDQGRIFIDPYTNLEQEYYIVYYKKDFQTDKRLDCAVDELALDKETHLDAPLYQNHKESSGDKLRTYRIAISCTAEYSNFHGGTINSVMSELAVLMNRINGVYETEVDIRMLLVANNDQLIFFNANTDPFNNNNSNQIVNQNQTLIDNVIGNANYDIGHVVSTGGGGFGPGQVCVTGDKARGVTGSGAPVGDPFYIDYVCHEIGHQFSAGHSFNGSSGSCQFAIWNDSSFEPGSGTTVMGYAGICDGQNIQNNSNDYFHTHSFDQIQSYITTQQGNTCGISTSTGNIQPTVDAGTGGYTIPKSTPFELIGSATDPNGDPLTYCWEQYDLGPQGHPNSPTGNAPLFRSFSPVTTPNRIFPKIADIVNNTQVMGEILPSYGRSLRFRLVARDNRAGGGGVNYDVIQFNVTNNAGPFLVTLPNSGTETWLEGTPAQITWDVANTDNAPVNASHVNIFLSMDGGYTYPVTLATNVVNNGSTTILVPQGVATNKARVRIQGASSVFFDISNKNFTITAPTAPGIAFWSIVDEASVCAPNDANFSINVLSLLNFSDPVNISAVNVPTGLVLAYNANPITPGQILNISAMNTSNVATGTYPIQLMATSGAVKDSMLIYLTVYAQTPTVVTPVSPADGSVSASTNPKLIWSGTAPHTYALQVASDPNFNNILLNVTGITDNQYIAQGLSGYSVYYWRVKADNPCRNGEYSPTYTFRTSTLSCSTFGSGASRTILSTLAVKYPALLDITEDVEIIDLNVRDLEGTHTRIRDLTFSLKSPAGTEVLLFDRICNEQDNFNLDLDDDAPNSNYPCPPTNGQVYKPQGVLANFNGENSAGTWTMYVEDHETGSGGQLANWELEICKASASTNADPIIVKNEGLTIFKGTSNKITNEFLQATDADSNPADLNFTIVETATSGELILNGSVLGVGSTFKQADIDNGGLVYVHDANSTSTADKFRFHVDDGVGGWAGTPDFIINIEEDNNRFELEDNEAWLYPNPIATGNLNLILRLGQAQEVKISVYDVIGQQILGSAIVSGRIGSNPIELAIHPLANGVYILLIEGSNFVTTEKFVVQKN
jgi:subtilisin-like proprotein convertase family protein